MDARKDPRASNQWMKVRLAAELPECELCGEPFCRRHRMHFADCDCPGPDQDDTHEYQERRGVLYARKKKPRR